MLGSEAEVLFLPLLLNLKCRENFLCSGYTSHPVSEFRTERKFWRFGWKFCWSNNRLLCIRQHISPTSKFRRHQRRFCYSLGWWNKFAEKTNFIVKTSTTPPIISFSVFFEMFWIFLTCFGVSWPGPNVIVLEAVEMPLAAGGVVILCQGLFAHGVYHRPGHRSSMFNCCAVA